MAAGNSSRSRLTETSIKALPLKASRYDIRDDQITGLVLRVAPTGRKTWSVSFRNPQGLQQRYTLGTWPTIKIDAARKLAKKQLGKVADDRDIAAERRQERMQEQAPTLKEFIDGEYGDWMDVNLRDADGAKARLKSTLKPFLNKRLDRITQQQVERWRTGRVQEGLSPATINRDLRPLRKALTQAVRWKLVELHPLTKFPDLDEANEGHVRWLSDDEAKRLQESLQSEKTPDYLRVAVVLAMNTGLRRGELLKLSWSSVDLKGKRLTVRAVTAKANKVRHVPLNSKALQALTDWQKKQLQTCRKDDKPDPVTVFNDLTEFKRSWRTLRDAAKLGDFRFHDFRHHFASKLVMAGIDLNTVRELLGHADIRMTLRYAHLAPEHKAAAVEVL